MHKSSCRLVEPVHRSNEQSVRRPHPQERDVQFTSFHRDRDRRHLTEGCLPCVINPNDRELNWSTKKTVLFGENNQPRHAYKSDEYAIESRINRKQRVSDDNMGKKRNYIPVSSLGDKPYNYPDRAPGFYKDGGLVVGSSIVQRTKTSSIPKKTTPSSTGSLKSLSALEKRELELLNQDLSSIETLTVGITCY